MKICVDCGHSLPNDKFNEESFSPETCFRCRISGVSLAIPAKSADVDSWRHDTIRDYGRRIVEEGRANGLDPVPAKYAGGVAPSQKTLDTLKENHLARPTKVAV